MRTTLTNVFRLTDLTDQQKQLASEIKTQFNARLGELTLTGEHWLNKSFGFYGGSCWFNLTVNNKDIEFIGNFSLDLQRRIVTIDIDGHRKHISKTIESRIEMPGEIVGHALGDRQFRGLFYTDRPGEKDHCNLYDLMPVIFRSMAIMVDNHLALEAKVESNKDLVATYSYSTDGERFTGRYDSPASAAEAAFNEMPEIEHVEVGRNQLKTAHDYVDAQRILEVISDAACDSGPECAGEWLQNKLLKDRNQYAELKKLIGDWLEKHEPVQFFEVDNIVEFERVFFEEPRLSGV